MGRGKKGWWEYRRDGRSKLRMVGGKKGWLEG